VDVDKPLVLAKAKFVHHSSLFGNISISHFRFRSNLYT